MTAITLLALFALAQTPRTRADCHEPTRHEHNQRENAITALGEKAAAAHARALSASHEYYQRKIDLGYPAYLHHPGVDEVMRLAQQADDAETAYNLAQRDYLIAQKALLEDDRRVKECLDDLADAEDARKAHKAPHATPKAKR